MNLHSSSDIPHGAVLNTIATPPVISGWTPGDEANFGRKPFFLSHTLAGHPLFQLDRLHQLAQDIHAATLDRLSCDCCLRIWRDRPDLSGTERMSSWRSKIQVELAREDFTDALAALFADFRAGRGSMSIMLCLADQIDPDFRALLARERSEIAAIAGVAAPDITFSGLTVIISAPEAVTPYHNDLEQNVLFQIQGCKDVYLYSQDDPVVLPQDVIEAVAAGDGAAARYRAEISNREACYRLEPGLAVHHPLLAPHWVKNDRNLSVSASMFLNTRASDELAHAHQANRILRQMGVHPPPPDLSQPADRLKALMLRKMSGPRDSYSSLYRGMERLKDATAPLRRALDAIRRRAA
ncbi:transcription factor jumonji JmjC domain protein [Methylocella silvestris BL2]|uniref:Transcription factor jumonji JmjC domain protein n=1 Tax=Methylocella silvestris (strain DSM 15510 / CIP 108128 / LMG 27833 / NCIMB 13906 / BL2) TaxID=395965 RepID=B8EMR4_METSB|nr:hypothetical protein [Methylocella silvestris]ACK52743.1 transcription factor jumonji JmjC domain protein [Methylocella silvestris BL2]